MRAFFSVVLVAAAVTSAACTAPSPSPPPPPPLPVAAPTAEPIASSQAPAVIAPAAPASSIFPPLAASVRADRTARVEELLSGGVSLSSDGPSNPRRVRVTIDGGDGQAREISGSNVDTCRFRLLPSPPAELKLTVVGDGKIVKRAKIVAAAATQPFAACAEQALAGSRLELPAASYGGTLTFVASAASPSGF